MEKRFKAVESFNNFFGKIFQASAARQRADPIQQCHPETRTATDGQCQEFSARDQSVSRWFPPSNHQMSSKKHMKEPPVTQRIGLDKLEPSPAIANTAPRNQSCVVSALKRCLQRTGECYGILNAGIHTLAAGRTMNVRGIASQQDSALPWNLGNAMLKMIPRGPNEVSNCDGSLLWSALRKNLLKICDRRCRRSLLIVATIRKWLPDSGATTTRPFPEKNRLTSSRSSGQSISTSASGSPLPDPAASPSPHRRARGFPRSRRR